MHDQVKVQIHGQAGYGGKTTGRTIQVDKGVRDLILLLNSVPGVETYNSCQGGRSKQAVPGEWNDPNGYVQFGGPEITKFLPKIINGIWHEQHKHVCRAGRSMTIRLEVNGDTVCLYWMPWDYRRLLRLLKQIKRMMPKSRRHATFVESNLKVNL